METTPEASESISLHSSLRERKYFRKREALIDAAISLFLENGFDKTSVDQIAQRADISRSTYFRYFRTKEKVVFPFHEMYLDHFLNVLENGGLAGPPLEDVFRALYSVCELFMADRARHLKFQQIIAGSRILIARSEEFDEQWEKAIADVLTKSKKPTALEKRKTHFTAGAILGLTRAIFREWFAGNCKQNLVELAREGSSVLEMGLNHQSQAGR